MSEPIGPTALYKNGECKVVEGDDVAMLESEGWIDTPYDKPADPEPAPEPVPDDMPEPVTET